MDTGGGYLAEKVNCPSCNTLHDLFIDLGSDEPKTVRFTCPQTGSIATWLCNRAVQIVKDRPESAIHAAHHVE